MVVNLEVLSVTDCANGCMVMLSLGAASHPELGRQRFLLTLSDTAVHCGEDVPTWLADLLDFRLAQIPSLVLSCYKLTSTGPRRLTSVFEIQELKLQWENVLGDVTRMVANMLGSALEERMYER